MLALAVPPCTAVAQGETLKSHALSMYGDVKYGPDFTHFDYANPDAPKGGEVRLAAIGSFDSLNPFIIKGVSATGMGLIYDNLAVGSQDEAFTQYGALAETIEIPEDRSWVAFTLRRGARWHDGEPVTAEDVIFSFEILTTKGNPFFRSYYADVEKVEKLGERTVKFTFGSGINRELPLIMGQLTVLPKHYWQDRAFDQTTLEPPLGSGPYRIETLDPGRSITYRRVPDYWGRDLPVNRGQNNFDLLRYDYYRDSTVAIEALKAHEYDFRPENISKEWATAYDLPAVAEGRLIKELVHHQSPTGMQGFVFNTRRPKFADPRVRQALAYAFDFEWTNTNLFYGQYSRTKSYFSNTELASTGLPQGQELDILERFRGQVPEEVFTTAYEPPATDGSGEIRENLRAGREILEAAGWTIRDGVLIDPETGAAVEIEFLLVSPAFERIVGPVVQNLKRLGIEAKIRIVDPAQYQNRLDEYDFDVIVLARGQSLSPGNEQRGYWTSQVADIKGGQNFPGIKDPVIDSLVELVIGAPDRASLVAATRALDRMLLWGHYVIPHWHIRSFRLVYWNMFSKPATPPKYGLAFPATWWVDQTKLAALQTGETGAAEAQAAPEAEPVVRAAADTAPEPGEDTLPDRDRERSIYLALAGFAIIALAAWWWRRSRSRPTS
jgi:microcin C transport system substrate-binding protein